MSYVRDPYDTDEPPCVCGLAGPARTTEEFCPSHGEPDGPFPFEPAKVRDCEVDGEHFDTYGAEHYWHCGNPGAVDVDGTRMCEDHAGERGCGPKQEEYGFDPADEPAKETGQ
jgi:hypothetical protein